MKAIKIASTVFFLGAVAALASCSNGNNGRALSARADATSGGGSWTQLTEVMDCRLVGSSLGRGIAGEVLKALPQDQQGNGGAIPGNGNNGAGSNPGVTGGNGGANGGNAGGANGGGNAGGANGSGSGNGDNGASPAAPTAFTCPGGTLLFLLNNDGSYRLSDGSNGKLSATELQQVNTSLGALSGDQLAQPIACSQGSRAEADHASFVTLGDGRIVTVSSMHAGSSCGFGSRSADIHSAILPIVQAHLNSANAGNGGGNNGGAGGGSATDTGTGTTTSTSTSTNTSTNTGTGTGGAGNGGNGSAGNG